MKTKPLDSYLHLCTQVYDLHLPTPPIEEYTFYRSYAQQAHGPILEPMCGSGRFLLPLAYEGFTIHGFDASQHMLASLDAKAKELSIQPTVWQQFLEHLDRPERYTMIFIPSGSFNLITDRSTAQHCLKRLYDHLSETGKLVLEIITPHWYTPEVGVWTATVWHKPDGSYIINNCCALPDQDGLRTALSRYELVSNNQLITTEFETHTVRMYTADEFIPMLEQAGFKTIRSIKAFDATKKPDEKDEVVIYECTK